MSLRRSAHLFLHFPCFDGIVSGVLAWNALSELRQWQFGDVHPVNYDKKEEWANSSLPPRSVVVDFLYHPSAQFWADHHSTTFVSPVTEHAYLENNKRDFLYDRLSPSTANILWYHFPTIFRPNDRLREMASWASKIDSADYDSVEEAVFGHSPAIVISQSLGIRADRSYCEYLVTALVKSDLTRVATSQQVQERYLEAKHLSEVGMRRVKNSIRLERGVALFETNSEGAFINRYSPYCFFPNANYSIGLIWAGDVGKLTVMRNPWRDFESKDLGILLKHFGGGGHRRVGSVLLRNNDFDSADEIIKTLVAELAEPYSTHKGQPR